MASSPRSGEPTQRRRGMSTLEVPLGRRPKAVPHRKGSVTGSISLSKQLNDHSREITPFDHGSVKQQAQATKSLTGDRTTGIVVTTEEAKAFWQHFFDKGNMKYIVGARGDDMITACDAKLILCNYRGCSLDEIKSDDVGLSLLTGRTLLQLKSFILKLWESAIGIEMLRNLCLGASTFHDIDDKEDVDDVEEEEEEAEAELDDALLVDVGIPALVAPDSHCSEEEGICLDDEYFDQFISLHSPHASSLASLHGRSITPAKASLSRLYLGDLITSEDWLRQSCDRGREFSPTISRSPSPGPLGISVCSGSGSGSGTPSPRSLNDNDIVLGTPFSEEHSFEFELSASIPESHIHKRTLSHMKKESLCLTHYRSNSQNGDSGAVDTDLTERLASFLLLPLSS